MIYLDHNATTPLHPAVYEAMAPYLREGWGNPSSPYRFGQEARAALERARDRLAECVGCTPAEPTLIPERTPAASEADGARPGESEFANSRDTRKMDHALSPERL